MKTLKSLSVLTAAVLSNSLSLNAASDAANKPNFVIIFCDDMGYGDLSCYGNPTIRTPNIDRMACEGMKLTQFYVGAGVSTPSRAALMTGRLPVRNGLYGDRVAVLFPNSKAGLGQDEVTIAKVLQQSGYATGCVGKWHLGAFSPYLPTDHGFDTYFGIPYSNDMSPVQNKGAHARNFPPTPLIVDRKQIESEPDQGELTRRYTEKAVSFIKDHSKEPFFLYFAHTFPHIPLYTNARFAGTSKRGLYGDVVEEIDWSVGEVLKALRENGLDENTFVIFTSDNGPWLTEHENGGSAGPLKDGKGTWWEGGFRVPAICKRFGSNLYCFSNRIFSCKEIICRIAVYQYNLSHLIIILLYKTTAGSYHISTGIQIIHINSINTSTLKTGIFIIYAAGICTAVKECCILHMIQIHNIFFLLI